MSLKNGIYLESKNKLLVENSLRSSTYLKTENNHNLSKLFNIANSNISLFTQNEFFEFVEHLGGGPTIPNNSKNSKTEWWPGYGC